MTAGLATLVAILFAAWRVNLALPPPDTLPAPMTVLMVSHNVSLIRSHTDRILCLNRELVFSGASADLTDEAIAEAYHAHPPGENGV